MKWENYFLKAGDDFKSFWASYLENKRDILFIMGMGFDPRTNQGIKTIYAIKSDGLKDTKVLRYYKQKSDVGAKIDKNVEKHLLQLNEFLESQSLPKFEERDIIKRSDDDKSIASINATQSFNEMDIEKYSDIILDISAIPRGIFLPLLNKLMKLVNDWNLKCSTSKNKNLHVIVTENAELDSKINVRGEADDGIFIHGLGVTDTAKTQNHKEVWIVLLGEGQTKQYDIIRKNIDPAEICPVLPFPSKDLKRTDRLIIEYQDLLFNDDSFDPKNIIYAHEENPFQVYRLIRKAILRYDESLNLLDGCKIIVSAFSSKLLTIGAFLAIFEARDMGKNAGIKHVESLDHELDEKGILIDDILKNNHLVHIWLAGDPYL